MLAELRRYESLARLVNHSLAMVVNKMQQQVPVERGLLWRRKRRCSRSCQWRPRRTKHKWIEWRPKKKIAMKKSFATLLQWLYCGKIHDSQPTWVRNSPGILLLSLCLSLSLCISLSQLCTLNTNVCLAVQLNLVRLSMRKLLNLLSGTSVASTHPIYKNISQF